MRPARWTRPARSHVCALALLVVPTVTDLLAVERLRVQVRLALLDVVALAHDPARRVLARAVRVGSRLLLDLQLQKFLRRCSPPLPGRLALLSTV